ncbi:MAG: Gfo/Idh/MocA family oxidoreductase [Candidatus Hydrogenedentes bacterium]|nr:Gfo/Idh/MocA family oxidoreductase [Candidatus Hydrogenedentota bacterium]
MRVGIIGCGGMGYHHARMATNCGLRVAACGDTVRSKAEALAQEYSAEPVSDSLALVRRNDVDIVAVCTPTPNHAPYVVAAAEAGKHIFCEKPFGRTVEQCREAIAAARKAKVKLFVAHVLRYFQEFEAIKAQIDAGKVGKVGFVKSYRGGVYPRGEANWFRDYAQSGGVTLDCIIHDFDWLRYVFGDAERVFCQALQRSEPDVLDYSLVTFRMKSGVIAHVIGTWAHPSGFRVKVEVCGDGGMLQFDSADAPISSMMREQAGGTPGMIIPSSPVPVSPYQLEWQDFVGWLEGKHPPRVKPEDGLKAVRMALGALESAKTGRPVKL